MVFACQKDSYQKELTSRVISCKPTEFKKIKNEKIKCYEVVMEDTILFPEGGGQPCDYGTINGIPVFQILRRGQEAIHYIEFPLQEGEEVKQLLNWERRLDHMQQHSGQHLLTALADSIFGFGTTSWSLGLEISYIELDTNEMTFKQMEQLEEIVNEKIRDQIPVTVTVLDENDPELDQSRTRGLPKDHKGKVRIITIQDIESNMCCGTHVTNLSQLQSIKLLGFEKGKKGKINLSFLVGNRVLKYFTSMYKREVEFNNLLKCNPDGHKEMLGKILCSNKILGKKANNLMKEVGTLQIKIFKSQEPIPKIFVHHKPEGDNDYMNFIIREMNNPDILHILSVGEKEGQINIYGPESIVAKLSPIASKIVKAKGNLVKNRFQGKAQNLDKMNQVVDKANEILNMHEILTEDDVIYFTIPVPPLPYARK